MLTDILLVLVFAKLAAEIAERLGIPAVVGEIVAGIAIGPSVLGWVHEGEVLTTLAEIGVILLLLEVGMGMDLRDLRAVGRAAMAVAVVGVAAPFAMGYGVSLGFDLGGDKALFLGAALAATSVGITARVFGDLHALATVEARTVMGAAVADDVIGLVILTVVVRLLTGSGDVEVVGVLGIIGLALAFLLATTVIGALTVPKLFHAIDRMARSSGTLFALALAFTLALAWLATAADLAPIIGAFVAGLALGRSKPAERIQRELTPVGHLFIPVFFFEIGIRTDVAKFADRSVLVLAGALMVVAVIGKVIAGWAVTGQSMDRLTVGVGMIPRGEVGLIFATIGLASGVLDPDTYAALLAVVLGTTLMTPPMLRVLVRRSERRAIASRPEPAARPSGGWLDVVGVERLGRVGLRATPPDSDVVAVTLQVASTLDHHQPDPALLTWISGARHAATANPAHTEAFIDILEHGGTRAWRFLESTGVLERAFPPLAGTLQRRRNDLALLEAGGHLRWPQMERTRRLLRGEVDSAADGTAAEVARRLTRPRRVLVASFIADAVRDDPDPERAASDLLSLFRLDADDALAIGALISDRRLLQSAAVRPDGLGANAVTRLAAHLRTTERVRELHVLTTGLAEFEHWEQALVDQLAALLVATLDGLRSGNGPDPALGEQRRSAAIALVGNGSLAMERIALAPVGYLVMETPAEVAALASFVDPVPPVREVFKVRVRDVGRDLWRVDIVARDRTGLLGLTTGVLDGARLDVVSASIVTWPDRVAVQSFVVGTDSAGVQPSADLLQRALAIADAKPLTASPVPDAVVAFDDNASPWHTIVEVRATDRRGLLHALSVAFAAAGADVHEARVSTADEMAYDRFDLSGRGGRKLDEGAKADIRAALRHGVIARPWRPWTTNRVGIVPKQSGD